jgi:hypothetical protein
MPIWILKSNTPQGLLAGSREWYTYITVVWCFNFIFTLIFTHEMRGREKGLHKEKCPLKTR